MAYVRTLLKTVSSVCFTTIFIRGRTSMIEHQNLDVSNTEHILPSGTSTSLSTNNHLTICWPGIDLHVLILQLYGPHLATVQLVLFEMFNIARFYAVIKRYDLLRSCSEKRTVIKTITELNYWCEQSTQRTQIEGCLFTCSWPIYYVTVKGE